MALGPAGSRSRPTAPGRFVGRSSEYGTPGRACRVDASQRVRSIRGRCRIRVLRRPGVGAALILEHPQLPGRSQCAGFRDVMQHAFARCGIGDDKGAAQLPFVGGGGLVAEGRHHDGIQVDALPGDAGQIAHEEFHVVEVGRPGHFAVDLAELLAGDLAEDVHVAATLCPACFVCHSLSRHDPLGVLDSTGRHVTKV